MLKRLRPWVVVVHDTTTGEVRKGSRACTRLGAEIKASWNDRPVHGRVCVERL